MRKPDMDKSKQQYLDFLSKVKTVIISTQNEEGKPFASYAPFVQHEDKLYIYISKVANHYRYIEDHPSIDVMLIEDESNTNNLFARQRARFECVAKNIGNEGYEEIFSLFETAFGASLIKMLRGLDFSLFELEIVEGRYVVGFGQAFDVSISGDKFDHVVIDKKNEAE